MTAHVAPRGRHVKGPTALGSDARRFVHLTATLAITDFKLRFFGSVLGYLWQLMRPLMLFGILYVVFTEFVRLGAGVRDYPVVLLTSIVLFTFFVEATGGSVTSVLDRESLVRKIEFPRMVIPLTVVVNAYFNLVLNSIAVLVFMLASGVEVRWSWLELPLLIGALGVFAVGIALLLSALYVRFRDLKPIWEVVSQVVFYGSPVLYPIESVPNEQLQHAIMVNPLAAILQQVRHAVIDPSAPSAAEAIGGAERLLIPAVLVVALFVVGLWVFNREAPRIAEEL
jgi:ABC-2 type transport system permease protein